MPRSDRHNEIELNLLGSGRLTYLLGGRKVEVHAGQLTAFWACVPHQILSFENLSEYFVMTIPLIWFLQWHLPDKLTLPILHGKVVTEPDEGWSKSDQAQFALWNADLTGSSGERSRACALEVEARLRRLALNLGTMDQRQPRRKSPALDQDLNYAEQMASFIALHYTEQLAAKDIAQQVGLHPNYAMTRFQQTFGTTLISYLTQHRLSHAQRLLVTTSDPVVEIAFNSGFGSVSRFHESFREAFGCTPREFRGSFQTALVSPP
jgi:AraC-like DNA-binding protein